MLVLNIKDGESLFINDLELKVHSDRNGAVLMVDTPAAGEKLLQPKKPTTLAKKRFRLHPNSILRSLLSKRPQLSET